MKSPVAILILVGALSYWSGAASAKELEEMSCNTTSCTFNEEMGPSQTKEFHGHCDGSGNTKVTNSNSSMTCNANKTKGMTCTNPTYSTGSDFYWACMCTNDHTGEEVHPTFDLTCPPPS